MNWVDVLIIIIMAINGLRGLSLGLVLSFFSIASYIVSGIVAKIYYPVVSKFILEKTNLIPKIQAFVLERIKLSANRGNGFQGTPEPEANIFEIMNLPKTLENLFMKNDSLRQYSQGVMDNIYSHLSLVVTKLIVDLISIVLIFLVVKFVLNIIGMILDGIASLPIINQFNRLGGLLFGILKGVIIIFILFAIVTPAAALFPDSFIVEGINSSYLAKYFYDYNILLNVFENLILMSYKL